MIFGKWLDRRKHSRREKDQQDDMERAIQDKHEASLAALEKLTERRFHIVPVPMERRGA